MSSCSSADRQQLYHAMAGLASGLSLVSGVCEKPVNDYLAFTNTKAGTAAQDADFAEVLVGNIRSDPMCSAAVLSIMYYNSIAPECAVAPTRAVALANPRFRFNDPGMSVIEPPPTRSCAQ